MLPIALMDPMLTVAALSGSLDSRPYSFFSHNSHNMFMLLFQDRRGYMAASPPPTPPARKRCHVFFGGRVALSTYFLFRVCEHVTIFDHFKYWDKTPVLLLVTLSNPSPSSRRVRDVKGSTHLSPGTCFTLWSRGLDHDLSLIHSLKSLEDLVCEIGKIFAANTRGGMAAGGLQRNDVEKLGAFT